MCGGGFRFWLLGVAAALLAGCGPEMTKLTDKVIVAEGTPPAPNSGVIRTAFGTVIVDGQPGYSLSESLKRAAEKRTGWEVAYLLLTSHHADHTLGNEVFRKAEIISTAAARAAFLERAEDEREMLRKKLGIAGLKSAQLMPATLTFEKAMKLYAGWPGEETVEVRMLEMPPGAAPGNMVVYLPEEKILFAGDLVTNRVFPYMGDADLTAWVRALDELEKLDVEKLVPGHGATGGKELIAGTRRLLADLVAAMTSARTVGAGPEAAKAGVQLPAYEKWPAYRQLLPVAVDRLWEQPLPQIELPPEPAEPAEPARPAEPAQPADPGKPAGKAGAAAVGEGGCEPEGEAGKAAADPGGKRQ